IESVRILHVETLKVLASVIGDWGEPAFPQFGLHVLRIPRLDAPAEIVEYRKARSTRTAAARAAAVGRCLLARRRRRRRLITAAQDETAPVPDVEHRLLTVVPSDLPLHKTAVVGGLLG